MAQEKPKKVKTINLPEEYIIDIEETLSHLLITKIECLVYLLECSNIDADKTIMGSEPMYKPILDDQETVIVKRKMLELISQL